MNVLSRRALTVKPELIRERDARLKEIAKLGPTPTYEQLMRGMSQHELALRTGITKPEIHRWLRGSRRIPNMVEGLRMATELGVSPYLLASYLLKARTEWLKKYRPGYLT